MRINSRSAIRRRLGERGASVIEVAFLAPWIFFLFVAVLDYGFYMYAAITVENAARVAALRCSLNSASATTALARTYVCKELQSLPNVGTSCPTSVVTVNSALVSTVANDNAAPAVSAVQVSVTYTTILMIPLPFLTGQWTFTRTVESRLCNAC